jgi:hypothetical protein
MRTSSASYYYKRLHYVYTTYKFTNMYTCTHMCRMHVRMYAGYLLQRTLGIVTLRTCRHERRRYDTGVPHTQVQNATYTGGRASSYSATIFFIDSCRCLLSIFAAFFFHNFMVTNNWVGRYYRCALELMATWVSLGIR